MTPDSEPVYFYRTAHPFSNFHPAVFTVDGRTFHTAEQYIMYRKALTFGDQASADQILAARDPGECKRLGRHVQPYDDAVWAGVREEVAFDACWHKFSQHARLAEGLLATGEALLVEASPSDAIWGVGFSEQDAPGHRHQWGQNLLGHALMRVREALRAAPDEESPGGA